jgi:hypothetical protein
MSTPGGAQRRGRVRIKFLLLSALKIIYTRYTLQTLLNVVRVVLLFSELPVLLLLL